MTVDAPERAKVGYQLGKDEGDAFWLLGMLETVKISSEDTGGAYGLLEVEARAGDGSPWHAHPDEDEWFYVLEGEFHLLRRRHTPVAPGRLVRLRAQGRAPHLHRRLERREGAHRLPAVPVRGLPQRGRRAGSRASAAAAARGAAGHGAAAAYRCAQRDGDSRPCRPATRALATDRTRPCPPA